MFNGPRAMINSNDGFGGASEAAGNLIFNACRETSDHGPINSWDRMPFLTMVRDGHTPSVVPAYKTIHHNFIVANYGSDGGCVDNDDGSSWYNIYSNFFLGGAPPRTRAVARGGWHCRSPCAGLGRRAQVRL